MVVQIADPGGPIRPARNCRPARAPACDRRSRVSPSTTRLAPSFSRCSTVALEWARARMSSVGLAVRACWTTWPASKASGMVTIEPARAGEIDRGDDRGFGGVAREHFGAVAPRPFDAASLVSITTILPPSRLQAGADQRADAAVADHDVVVGQGRRRRGRSRGSSGLRRPARPPCRCRSRSSSVKTNGLSMIETMAPARIEVARLPSGTMFEADAEPDQDEGELADLRQACRDGERGRPGMAEGADDQVGGGRLADDDDRDGRRARPAARRRTPSD